MRKSKKIIIITSIVLILTILILLIIYIMNNPLGMYKSKYGLLEKEKDIYIDVIDNTVTSTSLIYRIYNNTNEEITYAVNYKIERYINNDWKEYGISISWIDSEIVLKPNSNNEENIKWVNTYGKLPKGKYRIIKNVNNIILFDEFEIK